MLLTRMYSFSLLTSSKLNISRSTIPFQHVFSFIFPRTFCSESLEGNSSVTDVDVEKVFLRCDVQSILKRLTGKDMEKVFRTRKMKRMKNPNYQFVTDEELEKLRKDADSKADHLLQMPPVLNPRKAVRKILSKDPELQGFTDKPYIFTDISFGVKPRERIVVVREPDGTLRQGTWDERDRMNKIYFSTRLQKVFTPQMFKDETIHITLDRQEYEYLLDRACVQFEPDDPEYIRVCHAAYSHIYQHRRFDILHSTRHYGPMVFYLVQSKMIDDLLAHYVKKERIAESALIMDMYAILHPDSDLKKNIDADTSDIDKIKAYVKHEAVKKSNLLLVMQTYEEIIEQREIVDSELKAASGSKD